MNEPSGPHVPLPEAEPPAPPVWEPPPPPAEPEATLRPVPFEDREAIPGFWERVGAMFQLVFSHPFELFERTPATEGFGAPWRFVLLLSVPVLLLMALIFSVVGMGVFMAAVEEHGAAQGKALATAMPLILGAVLVLWPLFSFLGMVIGGALNHFFLWMWGGLRPGVGLSQTIRAYGYASAFLQLAQLLGLVPIFGILLQLGIQLAAIVVIGMGLARMHRTDTWRGICAALTPLVLVCCCGAVLMALFLPALIAVGHHY